MKIRSRKSHSDITASLYLSFVGIRMGKTYGSYEASTESCSQIRRGLSVFERVTLLQKGKRAAASEKLVSQRVGIMPEEKNIFAHVANADLPRPRTTGK